MKRLFSIITVFCFLSGHLLLFFIWQYYLNWHYLALVIFFFFSLSASASWLINWQDNLLTRLAYFISGLWGGVILNSLLLFLVFTLLNLKPDISGVTYWYFALQIPLLIFEFLSAYFLRVRRIEVEIDDLPDFWEGKKVLHISDVHLGPIWRSGFFKRIIKKVNDLKAEAIFITGDLFDGMEADFSWLNVSPNKLQAPSGVYYSFGNHDEMLGSTKVRSLLGNNGIKVLENKMIEKNGLQIIGLICGHSLKFDIKQAILKQIGYDEKKASLLLFHEPRNLPSAQAAGIDLQLSGHTHAGQMFPFNLVNKLLYNGHDFGVFKKGSFTLSVTAGTGTWGPPLRLGSFSEIVEISLKKLKS